MHYKSLCWMIVAIAALKTVRVPLMYWCMGFHAGVRRLVLISDIVISIMLAVPAVLYLAGMLPFYWNYVAACGYVLVKSMQIWIMRGESR